MCLKYHSVAFRSAVEIISQQTLWGDLNRIKNCPISIYRFKHSRLCTRKHISPLSLSNQTESIDSRICSEPSRLWLQKQNQRKKNKSLTAASTGRMSPGKRATWRSRWPRRGGQHSSWWGRIQLVFGWPRTFVRSLTSSGRLECESESFDYYYCRVASRVGVEGVN